MPPRDVRFAIVCLVGMLHACSSGGAGSPSDASTGDGTPTADGTSLADHPLAAWCDEHISECESYYPKCDTVRSPYYDLDRADGTRCWTDKSHSPTPVYPIVQCVPRAEAAGYTEPITGWDRLIDPHTGHCVSIGLRKYSPTWAPCEASMPACELGPVGGCVKADPPDTTCYEACNVAADCKDPAKPFCSRLGLMLGGDSSCNGTVRVCRAQPLDDCP